MKTKSKRVLPDIITELAPNEIFVFGSNFAGIHGAGAAKLAYDKFGAKWGVGVGPTGQCFAIATKDRNIKTLPLTAIAVQIGAFLLAAELRGNSHDSVILVTNIGCGLAGYTPEEIAPLFVVNGEAPPSNLVFSKEFQAIIDRLIEAPVPVTK